MYTEYRRYTEKVEKRVVTIKFLISDSSFRNTPKALKLIKWKCMSK